MELAITIAMVIGLTEAIKRMGLSKRYLPITAVILGVGLTLLMDVSVNAIYTGITAGLSAMGLWSGTRATAQI